ncbi:MAG TPA: M61 family peptidase [Bacteroidia bacterium]|jgi:predicted metalloprotease with PDZ domain|nr:M61 family peptidase [Bacteroidia bacterium]
MIKYKLFLKNPASHYIYVDLVIDNIKSDALQLQLPAWRPGRYELGNFAKNIKRVDAFDSKGNVLEFTKTTKDRWRVNTKEVNEVKITYSYYANELNAGACFADETQMYVNPVHLCMYVPDRMNEEHALELDIPDTYKIACQLRSDQKTLIAKNFDELADSPFIASAGIKTDFYEVNGIKFYLHFNGECDPDLEKIKKHFSAFTKAEINFWNGFPVDEYHFLFHVLPVKFYHGVEHQKSTVIVLGPGYHLNEGKTYEDLLGVSAHELFHCWNVKYIRPQEMFPYDFTKENYARTGYVYEGFTTYYGDVMLRTSGVFNDEQYFETLEERLNKHFHNYGRFNLSVAQSSWETWLDGYASGAPYRKTSIYDEGNLVAFMLDILILKNSQNKKSLKDACRILFNEFGKKNKGYTEQDIIKLCEDAAGVSLKYFFKNFVYGTEDFEPMLIQCFEYVGLEMQKHKNNHLSESSFGFKVAEHAHLTKVILIAPYSPAWKAGLSIGDEIMSVNTIEVKNDLNNWLQHFCQRHSSGKSNEIILTVSSQGKVKTISLQLKGAITYFDNHKIVFKDPVSAEQKTNYSRWILA